MLQYKPLRVGMLCPKPEAWPFTRLWLVAGPMVAAYCILRAFSWQLRLSPFPLEHLAVALTAPHPTPLLDEVRQQQQQGIEVKLWSRHAWRH